MTLPAPATFRTTEIGIMTATLGKAEREAAAAYVIRLHHFHKHDDWVPFMLQHIGKLVKEDDVAKGWLEAHAFARCTPDFKWLVDNGHLLEALCAAEGKVGPMYVTEKFTDAMARWSAK